MQLAGRALLILLGQQARTRQDPHPHLHIAERCDKQLACLMRQVADAQRKLDTYVVAQTDVGGERSK